MESIEIIGTVTHVLETYISALVDEPDSVNIEAKMGDRMITVNISAAKDDIGKIIGRRGRIISAIRVLMQAIVANDDKRINIVVLD